MQQSELAFQYVMNELLKQELDGPIALSLLDYTGDIMDIELVLNMTDDEIDELCYFKEVPNTSPSNDDEEEDGKAKPATSVVKMELPKGYKRLVKVFTSFHKYLREQEVEIYFDWTNIDLKTFTHYRQYIYNGNVTTPAPSRLVKQEDNKGDSKNATIKHSQVEQFKKSIKRDISYFTVLKDKKQFKSWHQNLLATAAAQDVEEVLDPSYKPSNDEEAKLFIEKQKYMYLVDMTILKTDRGIVFVGQHETDRDAQKVFEKVINS